MGFNSAFKGLISKMSVFLGEGGGGVGGWWCWWPDLEIKGTNSRDLQQQWRIFVDQKYGLEVRLK